MAVFEQLQIAALRRPRRPVMSRPFGTDDSRHSSRSSTSRSGRRWWAAAAAGAGAGAAAEGSLEQVALGNRNHQRTTILGFFSLQAPMTHHPKRTTCSRRCREGIVKKNLPSFGTVFFLHTRSVSHILKFPLSLAVVFLSIGCIVDNQHDRCPAANVSI